MERNGNFRAEREPLKRSSEIIRLPRVEEAHVELDDDWLVLGLGGLEDRGGRFVVRDVESADGLLGLAGAVQHLLHVYKHDAATSSIVTTLSLPYFARYFFV